jgi:hypothetical protein
VVADLPPPARGPEAAPSPAEIAEGAIAAEPAAPDRAAE